MAMKDDIFFQGMDILRLLTLAGERGGEEWREARTTALEFAAIISHHKEASYKDHPYTLGTIDHILDNMPYDEKTVVETYDAIISNLDGFERLDRRDIVENILAHAAKDVARTLPENDPRPALIRFLFGRAAEHKDTYQRAAYKAVVKGLNTYAEKVGKKDPLLRSQINDSIDVSVNSFFEWPTYTP